MENGNEKISSCILCKVITIIDGVGDNYKPNGREEEDVSFLFKILLEIPPNPGINLVVDGNLINCDHLLLLKSDLVRWCDQCAVIIKQARKLFQQISTATRKFRKIQQNIVEILKKCINDDEGAAFDKDENYKAIWRKLCLHNEGRFNNFEYPFIVQDWGSQVPEPFPVSAAERIDPVDSSSCDGDGDDDAAVDEFRGKNEDAVVKDENDEESSELPNTEQQRILLIFPKDIGRNMEDNDSGSLSPRITSPGLSSDTDDDGDEEEIIESNQNSSGKAGGAEDENDPLGENLKPIIEPALETDNLREGRKSLQNYCGVCKRWYKTRDILAFHKKRYHSSRVNKLKPVKSAIPTEFPCTDPQCQKFFKNSNCLRIHLRKQHPQLLSHQHRSTFQKSHPELYAKIVKNPNSNLFTCPFSTPTTEDSGGPSCSKTSKWRKPIEDHVLYKHLGEPGRYQCTWGHGCTRSFSDFNNFKSHMDRHKGTPRWKCDQCDKQFYSKNPYIAHRQREHEDGKLVKPFLCNICGKTFSCRDNLYCHKSIACKPGRSKKLSVTTNMKTRSKSKEDGAMSVPPSSTSSSSQGTQHMCHLCPSSFKRAIYLKSHLKKHEVTSEGNAEVPWSAKNKFQCSVKGCRMRFPKTELLDKHTKRLHGENGEKEPELKCQYCGKGFHLTKNLKHHEETHENEGKDPYECKVCGKGFRTMTYLKYHQKNTHKMKLEDKRKVSKR